MVKPTPPTAPEAPLRSDPAFSAKAQTFLTWLSGGFYSYVGDAVDFVDERADEALAAATTFGFPSIVGRALNFTRVNAAGNALEFRTPTQVRSDIGIGTMAVVARGATQSIPNVTDTAVSWDTVQINDSTIYAGGSPTRLTVPAGATRVRVTFSAFWGANNTGTRNLKIRSNNTSDIVYDIRPAQNETGATISRILAVTAGDYFEAFVSHNAGAALNIGGNNATAFSLEVLR
jgi:hypothetical protein